MQLKNVNGFLKFVIRKNDEKYSLPVSDLNYTIDVNYPGVTIGSPSFKKISKVIHHLLTSRNIEEELIGELIEKTKEIHPENKIDWKATKNFINYFKDYRTLYSEKFSQSFPNREKFIEIIANSDEREEIRKEVVKELSTKYKF